MGGSSSINGAAWTRGAQDQYDALTELLSPADQAANLGWNWASLFSYMRKAEKFNAPSAAQQAKGANYIPSYHGSSGPVNVAFAQKMYGGPQQKAFSSTVAKFGLVQSKDLNGGAPNCVSFTPDVSSIHSLHLHNGPRLNFANFQSQSTLPIMTIVPRLPHRTSPLSRTIVKGGQFSQANKQPRSFSTLPHPSLELQRVSSSVRPMEESSLLMLERKSLLPRVLLGHRRYFSFLVLVTPPRYLNLVLLQLSIFPRWERIFKSRVLRLRVPRERILMSVVVGRRMLLHIRIFTKYVSVAPHTA